MEYMKEICQKPKQNGFLNIQCTWQADKKALKVVLMSGADKYHFK